MPTTLTRIREAWNAFWQEELIRNDYSYGTKTYGGQSPSRSVQRFSNERSIISSIYTRIGIDVADVVIRHVMNDEQGRYQQDVSSTLNACLTLCPNLDQGPRAFRQDVAMTLFDEGVAAIVPIEVQGNPTTSDVFDIYSLRVGRVVRWGPREVRVSCYNELTGRREEVTLSKDFVAIVENPLTEIMNQPNSTLQRLIRKLNLLDAVDEQSGSGKLDLIIQLPYVIKSEALKNRAEQRRIDMEAQLQGSKYGIAYADGTEKVTQLNRPAENNLLTQVQFLIDMLYVQLGLTPEVMNGTADEKAMNNYYHRTIKPFADAMVEAMTCSFISNAGISRGERITYFRDPFKFVPMSDIAEIADKFTRNEITSSNEIRGAIGMAPSKDPKADKLVNSNMPAPTKVQLVDNDKSKPTEEPVA